MSDPLTSFTQITRVRLHQTSLKLPSLRDGLLRASANLPVLSAVKGGGPSAQSSRKTPSPRCTAFHQGSKVQLKDYVKADEGSVQRHHNDPKTATLDSAAKDGLLARSFSYGAPVVRIGRPAAPAARLGREGHGPRRKPPRGFLPGGGDPARAPADRRESVCDRNPSIRPLRPMLVIH